MTPATRRIPTPRRQFLALPVLALGLLAAACGGDGNPDGGEAGGGGSGSGSGGPGSGNGSGAGHVSTGTGVSAGPDEPVPFACELGGDAPAPPSAWTNVTSNLAGKTSECGNLTMVAAAPCSDRVIAGVARQGLWATTDGGESWDALGTDGGDPILHRPTTIDFDRGDPTTFWESGIYGWEDPWSMGVFVTKDNGASFTGYMQLSVIQSHQDSVSVDFHDPDHKTQLAGGHEQADVLFLSTDGGATFEDVGKRLPAGLGFCTRGFVLDAKNLLVGCEGSWSQKPGAILRSGDGGKSFVQVSDQGVRGPPLWAADGTMYWSAEAGGMLKSTDRGAKWAPVGDATATKPPLELPNEKILSASSDHIVVSGDKGATWTPVGDALPFAINGFSYSAFTKALYVWHNDCENVVLSDAVMRAGWDYTAE